MQPRIRAPKLGQKKIVIRIAQTKDEIQRANQLIAETYIREGFWQEGENHVTTDRWLNTPNRIAILVIDKENRNEIIGTVSIIKDSKDGLPADTFRPETMNEFRADGETLAQVTSLAFKKGQSQQQKLVLFLFKYALQFVLYYTRIERLISLCNPKHARFYSMALGFRMLGEAVYYPYAKAVGQLSTLHLVNAHREFISSYQSDSSNTNNFYHFLLVSEERELEFPDKSLMLRPRQLDWANGIPIQAQSSLALSHSRY